AAAVELHEANAFLHKPPGQNTVAAEVLAERVVHAVQLARGFGFFREVNDLWSLALHAERQLIRSDPRGQFAFFRMARHMVFVEHFDEVQPAALVLGFDKFWRGQIYNRISLVAERSALVNTRKEASTPVLRSTQRRPHIVHEYHKSRQVLVLASQPVGRPGAYAGSSRLDESRH